MTAGDPWATDTSRAPRSIEEAWAFHADTQETTLGACEAANGDAAPLLPDVLAPPPHPESANAASTATRARSFPRDAPCLLRRYIFLIVNPLCLTGQGGFARDS